ncbi:hypothetical protein ACIOHB_14425 [Streptomyces microflavus]
MTGRRPPGKPGAGLDSLTDTFHRLEGTAAAVGGGLLLETRHLVTELDST